MLEAAFWGGLGASSLVVGALITFAVHVPDRTLGLILAFGAGVLVSTVAYELVADALATATPSPLAAGGFAAGALTFYFGSVVLGRLDDRPDPDVSAASDGSSASHRGARSQGLAILLGTVLDGIPESLVLGLSLLEGEGVAIAFLVAVVISNLPESIGATTDMVESGIERRKVLGIWLLVVVASATAAAIGFAVLKDAAPELVAAVQMFAGGALIAMLAESMIPEAYMKGGRAVGLATAFGFAMSALLSFVS